MAVPVRVTLSIGYRPLLPLPNFVPSSPFLAPMLRPAAPALRDTIYTFSFPTNWAATREKASIGHLQVDRKPGAPRSQRRLGQIPLLVVAFGTLHTVVSLGKTCRPFVRLKICS